MAFIWVTYRTVSVPSSQRICPYTFERRAGGHWREIIAVCGKKNITLKNIFCGPNVEILMLKQVVSIATSELNLIIFEARKASGRSYRFSVTSPLPEKELFNPVPE
jgi:hypothetical protein